MTRRLGGLAVAVAVLQLLGCGPPEGDAAALARAAPAGAPAPAAIARGVVELAQGTLELLPPQDGSVLSVDVREGERVVAGQPLLRLADEALRREQVLMRAERDVVRARLEAQQQRLPAVRRQAERLEAAAQGELVDAQRAEEARQQAEELRSAVSVAQAELALAERRLEQAQAASARLQLRAPFAAQVLRVAVQPGARVSPQSGKPLMILLGDQPLRIRAEVNEAWVARVRPGMRARVFADGDLPADVAGASQAARVTRLSPLFGASRLDPEAATRAQARVLEAWLDLDDAAAAGLRAGQAVRVEFLP